MSKARSIESIIEELPQRQREGLTVAGEEVVSAPAETAPLTTSDLIGHMKDDGIGRMPRIHFVAEDDPREFWSLGDDRIVGGADITLTKPVFNAMQAGHICLRCLEPQPEAFPLQCDLCGYEMKAAQVRDLALEFDGMKHLGPSKPVQEYQDALEEEHLKKAFEADIAAGKSRMSGLKNKLRRR